MTKRSRVLGVALAALMSAVASAGAVAGPPAPASASSTSAPSPGAGFRCIMDAFGHTADGRIQFRRVVNSRVTVSKATRAPVRWRPISWGLVSANMWPDREITRQIVAATDGKVRLVETEWTAGGRLQVRVIKVLGSGFPSRLVSVDNRRVFYVGTDGLLHGVLWNGKHWVRPATLPVTLRDATAMTAHFTDRGVRIYYTDTAGALRVVTPQGAGTTDTVLRSSGYAAVTGMRAGGCMSPDYTEVRADLGLLLVERTTGTGRFQRVLDPTSVDGGTLTTQRRVRPSGWTWRRLG